MNTATETTAVQREIEIAASPETVWQFLVDPEKAVRWMGRAALLEPHPGGQYRVEVLPNHVARGEFIEVDRPRRLVHTWGWEPGSGSSVPPGSSTVEIELVPSATGTTLRFNHFGLPSAAAAESHAHGWEHYFERLAAVAAGTDPGPDSWLSDER